MSKEIIPPNLKPSLEDIFDFLQENKPTTEIAWKMLDRYALEEFSQEQATCMYGVGLALLMYFRIQDINQVEELEITTDDLVGKITQLKEIMDSD
ncbi:MAG: hypothetical protein U9Q63_03445 [Patescibacteria group bacterium]|nr:hypothetical protein [Patescibacteria group bacterium]